MSPSEVPPRLKPATSAEEWLNRGRASIRAGQPLAAIQSLAHAIQIDPDSFEAYRQLGALQQSLGDLEAAKSWYLLASACSRASASSILLELGAVCIELRQNDQAEAFLNRALHSPGLDANGYLSAGAGMAKLGLLPQALEALAQSIRLHPTASAWTELGACQFQLPDPVSAEASYRKALLLDPDYAPAHANLALTLLLRGDYLHGFAEFEWRLKLSNFYHIEGFDAPPWRGEPLAGKTILLHAEQGFGDTLQFLRFLPLVAARAARVHLIVQAALHRLVAGYSGVSLCLTIGSPLPPLDFHCSLMSLPHLFSSTLATIPPLPSLALPRPGRSAPREKSQGGPLLVGLAWAGNPRHRTDSRRTLHLSSFAELAALGDAVSFVSLQHGPAAAQLAEAPPPFPIRDACSAAADFADTADVIAGLDLVIAVDTAVAHLAASLGKPVWVLLGPVPEWRWGLKGETTPWYPSMRLFRAQAQQDWSPLMKQVTTGLQVLCRERAARHRCGSAEASE